MLSLPTPDPYNLPSSTSWPKSAVPSYLATRIGSAMPKLTNTLREKLFGGYGPFGSLSVKIDVAYALDKISSDVRHDLHVIRDMRNAFAHPRDTNTIHFQTGTIGKLIANFRGYKKAEYSDDPLPLFLKKVHECWEGLGLKNLLGAFLINYDPKKP